jgi:hypothetical protein
MSQRASFQVAQECSTREARKAQLLKTWETERLQRLASWLESLTNEEGALLLEAVQEKTAAEAAG